MPKVERHTHPIDDKFAAAVLTNQLNCNAEMYRLKRFALPDQDNYPEDYAFTANIQKYINRLAEIRLGLYKHAMRDIESVTTESITSTNYARIIENTNRYYYMKNYSNESLLEYLTDICTYTRCAYMKGLSPTKYWPIRYMAEFLYMLRNDHKFTDWSYSELDEWLKDKVRKIERETGHLSLKPVELTLEWVNYPIPYNFCLYKSVIKNLKLEKSVPGGTETFEGNSQDAESPKEISENLLGRTDTSENMSGNSKTSGYLVNYDSSDTLSPHSDTSDNFSGNYYTTEDEDSEVSEHAPKKFKMSDRVRKT